MVIVLVFLLLCGQSVYSVFSRVERWLWYAASRQSTALDEPMATSGLSWVVLLVAGFSCFVFIRLTHRRTHCADE